MSQFHRSLPLLGAAGENCRLFSSRVNGVAAAAGPLPHDVTVEAAVVPKPAATPHAAAEGVDFAACSGRNSGLPLLSLCGLPCPSLKPAGVCARILLGEKPLGVVDSGTCARWHAGTQHAVQASA